MSGLPSGWEDCALEDVASDINYGYTAKSNPLIGDAKMLRITDIQDNKVDWATVPFCEISKSDKIKYSLRKGDLVFARTGATVGKSFLIRDDVEDGVFASYLIRVRSLDTEMTNYLSHFFNSYAYWGQITEFSSGIGQPNVNGSKLKSLRVPLAPLPEQKRIADKLDTMLARVDACRERLNRVPLILKRFKQSVLAAATSGKLTEDWREARLSAANTSNESISLAKDELHNYLANRKRLEKKEPPQPDLTYWSIEAPTTWVICSVNQFAECWDRLRVPIKREDRKSTNGHFPYYGANGEVGRIDEYIFDDELVLVTEDETFYGREKPIAYRSSGKCWVNNHAHVLKPKSKIAADYLCYALMYYDVIPWLSGTTGRAKLTQAAMNSLPMAMPPELEMIEIVRRVETLFAFADRLEARLSTARNATERLTPALLAKAFRGELVPQDPNDEPANLLLQHLAENREIANAKPSRGRTSKKEAI